MTTKLVRCAQIVGIYPAAYTAGLALGGYLKYQKSRGRLVVIGGEELLVRRPRGTLIIANHPSIMEPWTLIGLHARQYLWNPNRIPWSTPDFGNFVNHWYGQWLLVRTIPVYRGSAPKAQQWVDEVIAALERGETVIVFPEGGRTRSIKNGERYIYSKTGRTIRPFKIRRLLEQLPADIPILPIWVEREWDNRPDVSRGLPDGFKSTTVVVGLAKTRPLLNTAGANTHWCEEQVLEQADALPPLTSPQTQPV